MSQYLLSTYAVEDEAPGAPRTPDQRTPEEMQAFMQRVVALEEEMEASDTFVFGGASMTLRQRSWSAEEAAI
jgi:hypothetical protein